jgi:hypothetical protein
MLGRSRDAYDRFSAPVDVPQPPWTASQLKTYRS